MTVTVFTASEVVFTVITGVLERSTICSQFMLNAYPCDVLTKLTLMVTHIIRFHALFFRILD